LRTFLIACTVVAPFLGWVASERMESARQLRIAKDLTEITPWIDVVFGGPYDVHGVAQQSWWRRCAKTILGSRVTSLVMAQTGVRNVTPIGSLQNLTHLTIADAPFVVDLTPLAELTNLRSLDLCYTGASDFTPLYSLSTLEVLRVANASIGDEQWARLKESLPNCKVTVLGN